MKKVILGFVIGVLVSFVLYFYLNTNKAVNVYTASLLDRDTIYMADGTIIKGWITTEDDEQVWIESEKSFFSIPRIKCQRIQHNSLMKYLREIM